MKKELIVIKKSKSWKECNQRIAKLTTGKQAKFGANVFEHVVKLYLQTEPKYRTKFKQVWLLDEVPLKVKKLLRLPQADEGIDLVIKINDDWKIYKNNIRFPAFLPKAPDNVYKGKGWKNWIDFLGTKSN